MSRGGGATGTSQTKTDGRATEKAGTRIAQPRNGPATAGNIHCHSAAVIQTHAKETQRKIQEEVTQ